MKRNLAVYLMLYLSLTTIASCSPPLSEDEIKTIEGLRSELVHLQEDIDEAKEKDATLAGGLVKALVEARLEILKITEALLQQRIHAIESGAKIEFTVAGSNPDLELAKLLEEEINSQKQELDKARQEAARYSGGLVAAMKSATVATSEQTLAMLNQRLMVAKYGLPIPTVKEPGIEEAGSKSQSNTGPTAAPDSLGSETSNVATEILEVRLLRKSFSKQDYQDYIFFDIEFTAKGLDKPTRAIKGTLHLQDLFGETRMSIGWTIEKPMTSGQKLVEKGSGFEFNQFIDSHQWTRSTALENMTASMTVRSILYQDGTRVDF